jgi:exodeoxyribonuclease V alpha subunit
MVRIDQLPALSPTGTARKVLAEVPAFPHGLLDLLRASDLDETSAYLAWQFAELAQDLTLIEREAFLIIIGRLLAAQALGSTRLAIRHSDRALLAKVPELVGGTGEGTPLILEGNHLYTQRAHAAEERVATALVERLSKPTAFSASDVARVLGEVVAIALPTPSDEQKAAVATVLGRQLGVISGGPGTGKTTTALTLVRCLVRLGIPPVAIALSAPTGKAASRLEDDLRSRLHALATLDTVDRSLLADCPKAQTLHRLLGATYGPLGLLRAGSQPLPFRAVIVDESSMIDLLLMDRLLSALADDTLLVLLGDGDQLPSVSAGAVFRDLGGVAVRLGRGFRTDATRAAGQQLAMLAAAIRSGEAQVSIKLCTQRQAPDDLVWQGAEHLPSEHRDEILRRYHTQNYGRPEITALVERAYTLRDGTFDTSDGVALDALLAHLGRTRILAVTLQRITGVERTNAFLHELHGGGPMFLPGEPVLMLRNDYQRELWNGDQGVAVRVRRSGQHDAVLLAFRSRKGWQVVDAHTMGGALDFGFALTVHKSQGSEFDQVILLLPDSVCPLLSRELLYTALSRARSSVVLCGTLDGLQSGVTTKESRNSGVAERLALRVTPIT